MEKQLRHLIILSSLLTLLLGGNYATWAQEKAPKAGEWDPTNASHHAGSYTISTNYKSVPSSIGLTGDLTLTATTNCLIRKDYESININQALFVTNGHKLTIIGAADKVITLNGYADYVTDNDARTGLEDGATSYLGHCIYVNGGSINLNYVNIADFCTVDASTPYPQCGGAGIIFCNTSAINSSVQNAYIYGCRAYVGSAVMFYSNDKSNVTFTNVEVKHCYSSDGTIATSGTSDGKPNFTLDNCRIYENSATNEGGGISWGGNSLTIQGTTSSITDNIAGIKGGGICQRGSLTLQGTITISGNKVGSTTANNVHIALTAGNEAFVRINELNIGSHIGVTTDRPTVTDVAGSTFVPIAYNNVVTANNFKAYNRDCFFDDANQYSVFAFDVIPASESGQNHYYTNAVYFIETWLKYAEASGTTTSADGNTITVNNAAGLAYIAKQVKNGNTYEGKTVQLSADIDLSAHYWEPIGIWVQNSGSGIIAPFLGTFDGNGHTISNANSLLPFSGSGVFGLIGTGSEVKNTFVSNTNFSYDSAPSISGFIGKMDGGTVYNCGATGVTVKGSTNVGGLVGSAASSSSNIHSCYVSNPTFSSGTNRGGIIGKLESSSSLKNSFANTSIAGTTTHGGLVGITASTCTVENCYVRNTTSLVGTNSEGTVSYCYYQDNSGSPADNTFNATQTPYLYRQYDNQVTATSNTYVPTGDNKQLLTTLNNWVTTNGSSTYTPWMRTCGSPINGDYPVLKYPGVDCVASRDNVGLEYGKVFNTKFNEYVTDNVGTIFLYKTPAVIGGSGTTAYNVNVSNYGKTTALYIDEHVALKPNSAKAAGDIIASVGITLDNSAGAGGANPSQGGTDNIDWHLFSSALDNLPIGFTYNTSGYTPGYGNTPPAVTFTTPKTGYFPTNLGSYYSEWDFYSYSEPDYHWINMKRASDDHWHSDYDYWQIHYTNEDHFVEGRGYLVATAQDCFLQAYGTLNNGDVTSSDLTLSYTPEIAFTTREGFNVLGNPYQSYLDFDKFADENSSIWTGGKENSGYIIIDEDAPIKGYAYYAYSASPNPYGGSQYLHPHQGFIVMVDKSGVTPKFTNAMRSVTGTSTFRDVRPSYPLVNLIVTEESGNRDLCTVELGRPDKGGLVKAKGVKAGKGSIYCHYDDEDYAIVFTQPGISEVGIRFETPEDDTFTLTWDTENGDFGYLHLIDNKTGNDIDCLTTNEYRFSANADDYKSRFRLVFNYTGVEENGQDGPSTGLGSFAFVMGNELVVNGEGRLEMIDMLGRVIKTETLNGVQSTTALPATAGVYVLRLTGKDGVRVQKMIVE